MTADSISEWFKDHSYLASIVLAILSIYLAGRRMERKRLVLAITSEPLIELFPHKGSCREKASLMYEGTSVEGVYKNVVKLINSGNRALATKDIISPLQISLDENVHVFEAIITNSWNLEPSTVAVIDNQILPETTLIQPGEYVEVRPVTNFKGKLKATIRASDFRLYHGDFVESVTTLWQSLLVCVCSVLVLYGFTHYWKDSFVKSVVQPFLILFLIFGMFTAALAVYELRQMSLSRRRSKRPL